MMNVLDEINWVTKVRQLLFSNILYILDILWTEQCVHTWCLGQDVEFDCIGS